MSAAISLFPANARRSLEMASLSDKASLSPVASQERGLLCRVVDAWEREGDWPFSPSASPPRPRWDCITTALALSVELRAGK